MTPKRFQDGPLRATVSDLVVRPTGERRLLRSIYTLECPLTLRVWAAGLDLRIVVPAGFRTDFASIPAIFWPFIGAPDRYAIPAVFHDYFCVERWPRWAANAMLRSLLELTGDRGWRAKAIFWAVQAFGYASPISGWLTRSNVKRTQKTMEVKVP